MPNEDVVDPCDLYTINSEVEYYEEGELENME